MSIQVRNLEQLLAWVKSSPCEFTLSSMSGGCVHVKFTVPSSCSLFIDQKMRDKGITPRDQWEREVKEAEAIEDAIEDRDELMNQCYEDGFKDGLMGCRVRRESSK